MSEYGTLATKLATLPVGSFHGVAQGRTYVVSRSLVAGGKGEKIVAEALDGSDYISLNLYHLAAGATVKPCEMPLAKVVAFVMDLQVSPTAHP